MRKINYKDLQLDIEKKCEREIEKDIKNVFFDYDSPSGVNYQEEKHFHNLLIKTIQIKGHYLVDAITNRIKNRLELENSYEFKLYLYQNNVFNINCFLRKEFTFDQLKNEELLAKTLHVFVSQHFFNSLTEDEQVGIIGHEIAHQLFQHFKYPIKGILNVEKINANISVKLKSNLIYRRKFAEITADLVGLVSNDFNFRSYCTALIKFTTGLDDSSNSTFSISPLLEIVLKQYDDFAKDPYIHDMILSHPIMPLRVKIINEVMNTKLIRNFGETLSLTKIKGYKKEFNDLVNSLIYTIYPELFLEDEDDHIHNIIILMSIAVVLADKEIHESEDKYIKSLLKNTKKDYSIFTDLIFKKNNDTSFEDKISQLIDESILITQKKTFNNTMVVPIIRKLLLVAASDGEIVKEELKVIYDFAKHFSITKKEIAQVINTQYNK